MTFFTLMKRRQMHFKKRASFEVNRRIVLLLCSHRLPFSQLIFSLWWRRLKNTKFNRLGEVRYISMNPHNNMSNFFQLELDLSGVPFFFLKLRTERNRESCQLEHMCFPLNSHCMKWLCVRQRICRELLWFQGYRSHNFCLKWAQPVLKVFPSDFFLITEKGIESHGILIATVNQPLWSGDLCQCCILKL